MATPDSPDYVKLGLTCKSITQRLAQLNSRTNQAPGTERTPFVCVCARFVNHVRYVERRVHTEFAEFRAPRGEFFKVPVARVRAFFETFPGRWWQPTDEADGLDPFDDSDTEFECAVQVHKRPFTRSQMTTRSRC